MDLSVAVSAAVVAVGFLSGVLAGSMGVGGAVITTPGIRLLGATPIEAIGSTIPAILPAATAGSLRYRREGLIDLRVALTSGAVGIAFAVGGAKVSDVVDARYLMLVTAGLLGLSAVKFATDQPVPPAPPAPAWRRGRWSTSAEPDRTQEPRTGFVPVAATGAAAGSLAGLLGVGGGVVMVPVFTTLLRLPAKRAVATSLLAVAIFSVPAMITHALLGHIDWAYALLLTVGVIPGARAGAHLTIRASESRLRLVMALFFGAVALVYAAREIHDLMT